MRNKYKIIEKGWFEIDGVMIEFLRKKIRHLNLRICSPNGEVKVSMPSKANITKVKKFVLSKILWIKDKQRKVLSYKKIAPLKFFSGEMHYFFGDKYCLELVDNSTLNKVKIADGKIFIYLKKSAKPLKILDEFYRHEMKRIIPPLIKKYEELMVIKVAQFGVKKMRTRWGTCNIKARRIWLNLELAKNNLNCLEYIVVHEMVHLLERNHTKRFYSLMDKFMPDWKDYKRLLQNRN